MSDKATDWSINIKSTYDPAGSDAAADAMAAAQQQGAQQQQQQAAAAQEAAAAAQQAADARTAAAEQMAEAAAQEAEAAQQQQAAAEEAAAAAEQQAEAEQELAEAREEAAEAAKKLAEEQAAATEQAAEAQTKAAEAVAGAEAQATQAAEEHTRAAEQDAAATEQAAEATDKERYALEVALMGKRELIAEMQKLTAARKQAAAAHDTEAYDRLTEKLARCKQQMRELTQAKKLNQLAMMGQAQNAAALAGQLKSLASQAQSGSTDIAGMAMQVVSLGMAFKAALGPIGWVMLAIQGCQMAFNAWMEDKEAKQKADLEEMQRVAEQMEKLRQQYKEMLDLRHGIELEHLKNGLTDAFKAAQKVQDDTLESARRTAEEEERTAAAAAQAADALLANEKARIELAKVRGEMTDAQAEKELRAAEDAHTAELTRIAKEGEARKTQMAELAVQTAAETETAMQSALQRLKPVAAVQMPTEAEYKELQKRLELLDDEEGGIEAEREMRAINKTFARVRKMLKDAGIAFEGGNPELLKFVADIREMVREGEGTLEQKRKERKAASEAAGAAQGSAELAEQKRQLDAETLEAQREVATATREKAEAAAAQAEAEKQAAELQRKTLEQLRDVLEGTQTAKTYAVEDNRNEAEILRADKAILAARKQQLEELRRTPGLDEATLKQIDKELTNVEQQTRGLAQAQQRAAQAARGWIAELQPPQLQARKKHAQRALDNLAKQFQRQADAAAKAVKSGDDKAMQRTRDALAKTARAMGNVSKDAARVDALYKETAGKLDALADGTKVTMREAKDTARSSAKLAGKTDEAATAMGKVAKDAKAMDAPAKVQDAAAAARTMEQLTKQVQTELGRFTQDQAQLLSMVGAIATAAGQGAAATAAAVKSLTARCNGLQRQVDAIKRNM